MMQMMMMTMMTMMMNDNDDYDDEGYALEANVRKAPVKIIWCNYCTQTEAY
jgi:hypothetical protein